MVFINTKCFKLLLCLLCFCWFLSFNALLAQSSQLSISALSISVNDNDSIENAIEQSIDGPYVFRNKGKCNMVMVTEAANKYKIVSEAIDLQKSPEFKCIVDNEDRDNFTFQLMDKITTPKARHKQPEKLLAISDIEGNFNALYSLLTANGVMDKAYNWTYGAGHLVFIGDIVDRGENVTQVLWLIYKLEQEAEKQGGMVHFILGNHEILNLEGAFNYINAKYLKVADAFTDSPDARTAYGKLMTDNQELVRWMKSKNTLEKIGNTLFVHGGISPELLDARFSIDKINYIIRRRLDNGSSRNSLDKQDEDFLFASYGPLWYRGMASAYRNYYKKMTEKEVKRALRYYKVKHIAIGHTIADKISTDYDGRVIRTDVNHAFDKASIHSQALLITDNQLFRVDGQGNKVLLIIDNSTN